MDADPAEADSAHDRTRVFNERFTAIAAQLGDAQSAVRLAGVHAMAGLADDRPQHRQTWRARSQADRPVPPPSAGAALPGPAATPGGVLVFRGPARPSALRPAPPGPGGCAPRPAARPHRTSTRTTGRHRPPSRRRSATTA